MRIFADLDEFAGAVGEELGTSAWVEITQEQVNKFADATNDHQWIHVDPEQAAKHTPWGGTIAHGYLTVSLITSFMIDIYAVHNVSVVVNFGINKVRFHKPVPVGSRIRATAKLLDLKNSPAGKLCTMKVHIELEGERRPAVIAETLALYQGV